MRFLVDAHLPPGLCVTLQTAGHDAVHTRQLPAQNLTTDDAINTLSVQEQRVVITKDTDFYYSHLLRGEPWKLLLIRTGNIRTRDLTALLARHLPAIITALQHNSLVELDRQSVQVIA
jgi:predicted nuclease of predicted toxin-antitoxin system